MVFRRSERALFIVLVVWSGMTTCDSLESKVIQEGQEGGSPEWPSWSIRGEPAAGSKGPLGCAASGLCCQGRNNSCSASGGKMNGGSGDLCYCDSSCLALKDCCLDYAERCPARDCQLGPWGEWSDCDSRCGFGVRQRTRVVQSEQANGGKECEPTNQKQVCEGSQCKLTRDSDSGNEMRETGRILPLEFSRWRNDVLYDPYKDIRRNIFFSSYSTAVPETTTCAAYTLQFVHPSCSKGRNGPGENPAESAKKGDRFCVECHPTATLDHLGGRCFGQGLHRRETRWSLLLRGKSGCRGTWIMEEKREECTCFSRHPSLPGFSFI